MEAIILAGGAGSRLRPLVADVPKPMAPVQGRPFLSWLLSKLERQGVSRAVISTGYLAEAITSHFGGRYGSMDLAYAHETEPQGTGGALRQALREIQSPQCLMMNGDSFFDVDLPALDAAHRTSRADLTLALKPLPSAGRYGIVDVAGGRVVGFREKPESGPAGGLINGGVYLASPGLFENAGLPPRFSFEKDFLMPFCSRRHLHGFVSDGFFIDIGVPDDYLRAQSEPCFQPLPHL